MHKQLYDTQKDFIKKAVTAIRNNKNAAFSSPTGTGKTLSLLCTLLPFINTNHKIYYCSRTHGQLTQVINELKTLNIKINAHALGSRKVYCINKSINKNKSIESINEQCRSEREQCIFYKNTEYKIAGIKDIEDIVQEGSTHIFCPYYSTKKHTSSADILFLPYNILLTKEGRASAGLELKDAIVVVDEAHNLYDSIVQMNSVRISHECINKFVYAFKEVYKRNQNNADVKTVIYILERINNFLEKTHKQVEEVCLSVSLFVIEAQLSCINMLDVDEFIRNSNIAQKILRKKYLLTPSDLPRLYDISRFLYLLTMSDEHGRIFYVPKQGEQGRDAPNLNPNLRPTPHSSINTHSYISFTPLSPKLYIEDLLEAKSIILAGGTMEPIEPLKTLIGQLDYFSYNSICTSFVSFIIKELRITYERKGVSEAIRIITQLSTAVSKGGIVVFLPSKSYMECVKRYLSVPTNTPSIHILYDDSFEEYKLSVLKQPTLLFSVINGRLSEGINFSDTLCRLLVVVGVPYPSLSEELRQRTAFYGYEYPTMVAMKGVNQAMGRALRHRKDYAALVLLDGRYEKLKGRLSPWLQEKTVAVLPEEAVCRIKEFLSREDLRPVEGT